MRLARRHIPGLVHHLIWRCLNREFLIQTCEHRHRYLWWLGRALRDSDWKCVAYCVMSNHIHIAAVAGEEPLAAWSRRAHSPFAAWMNQVTGRLGPFFADRASDYALGEIAAASTIGYIHNNPVRARLAARARDSDWSSHRAYVGLAAVPDWLHVDEGLYRAHTASRDEFERYVDGAPIPPERPRARAAHVLTRHGQINGATPHDNTIPLVMRSFARLRPDPRAVVRSVGTLLGLDVVLLASRRRTPELVAARRVVAHSGALLGLTGGDIASVLGISPQGVSFMLLNSPRPTQLCEKVCALIASEARTANDLVP